MRTFLAVELGDELRNQISLAQQDLRQRLDREASKDIRITWVQPSTYSEEYNGSSIATHSPQPVTGPAAVSASTSTISASRVCSVPKEVVKGLINGIDSRCSRRPVMIMVVS